MMLYSVFVVALLVGFILVCLMPVVQNNGKDAV
jgi:hypothetical protein